MNLTPEQEQTLAEIKVERIKDVHETIIKTIRGAVIEGKENKLASLFKRKKNLLDDQKDILASYVVLTPADEVLAFFSLRCGELFKRVDLKKMEVCQRAWDSFEKLYNTPTLSPAERNSCIDDIREARNVGVNTPDEIRAYALKNQKYQRDKKKWSYGNIEQVSDVFPAVELTYLGINEKGKSLWNSYNMPQRLGETMFWYVVMQKKESVCSLVGCQYVYLFAADKEPDGDLVNYYQTRLHFAANTDLNANKPHFDLNCRFMYQDIETLKKYKDYFFDHFDSVSSK